MSETENLGLPVATGKGRKDDSNCNIALFGDHGGGKTTWMEEILLARKRRLVVYNTRMRDYGSLEFQKETGIKYDAVLDDPVRFVQFLSEVKAHDPKSSFRVVFTPPAGKEETSFRLFQTDPELGKSPLTDTTFCIDEIHYHMDKDTISPAIEDHLAVGRHNRNNLIGASQVPKKQTNNLYQAGMDMFISFRQTQDSAIDFFSEFSKEKAAELMHLRRGHYRLFRGTKEDLLKFIETP